jgi:molybdenum cofactor cytidylyltransferase
MTPVGILLAAGRGTRFDPTGASDKLLAPYGAGGTVVGASARHLLAAVPHVIAVVAPGASAVARELEQAGCIVTVCPDAAQGMGVSLVHAVRASLPAPLGWVIALGDMPDVLPSTIEALCDALADGAQIAAPSMHGRRGNPVAFGPSRRDALLALGGDQGARSLLLEGPVTLVEVPDAGIFRDIDAPGDLRAV